MLITIFLFGAINSIPHKCKQKEVVHLEQQDKNYWNNGCNVGGVFSVNEFGANICEYPGDTCPVVKYFSYQGGGGSVELCCNSHSDCNYDPIKNYCHPEYKRCIDGSYVNCSNKGGPLFENCL
jgi:hypothetical protein